MLTSWRFRLPVPACPQRSSQTSNHIGVKDKCGFARFLVKLTQLVCTIALFDRRHR